VAQIRLVGPAWPRPEHLSAIAGHPNTSGRACRWDPDTSRAPVVDSSSSVSLRKMSGPGAGPGGPLLPAVEILAQTPWKILVADRNANVGYWVASLADLFLGRCVETYDCLCFHAAFTQSDC
jgi:hypothetical protein